MFDKKGFHLYKKIQSSGLIQIDNDIPCKRNNKNILLKFIVNLLDTYKKCNEKFSYDISLNPKRIVTFPCEGVNNQGFDNENHDYILKINDILISKTNDQTQTEYIILDLLGSGTFGQVVKCQNKLTKELCAIKIIKNLPSYYKQGKSEISILKKLNDSEKLVSSGKIVKLLSYFLFRKHLCLVFELLDASLYDLLTMTEYKGIGLSDIGWYTKQILEALMRSERERIIHCDIKPENILFVASDSREIKVIDYGSACIELKTIYSYIQSRHYRSPEVLLGCDYGLEIDIWSLGCVVAELYLGLPIFPGNSEYDQIRRIVEITGYPPEEMILKGKKGMNYFKKNNNGFVLKTLEEYETSENKKVEPPKQYFVIKKLDNLLDFYSESKFRENEDSMKQLQNFDIFLDFLKALLTVDKTKRVSSFTAYTHPFIQRNNNFSEKIEVNLPFFNGQKIHYNNIRKKVRLNNAEIDYTKPFVRKALNETDYQNIFKKVSPTKKDNQKRKHKNDNKKSKFANDYSNYNNNFYQNYYPSNNPIQNNFLNYPYFFQNTPIFSYNNYYNNGYSYWNNNYNCIVLPNDLHLQFSNMNLYDYKYNNNQNNLNENINNNQHSSSKKEKKKYFSVSKYLKSKKQYINFSFLSIEKERNTLAKDNKKIQEIVEIEK